MTVNRLCCFAFLILASCSSLGFSPAAAQELSSEAKPSPSPGSLDIQHPGPRVTAFAGFATGSEYRDALHDNAGAASLGFGFAYQGFSASAWTSQETSSGRGLYEILAAYSYKLPFVDVHAGYVVCGNDWTAECPGSVRLAVSTNAIDRTTLAASFDAALDGHRRITALSLTRDLWSSQLWSTAVRAGWTHTDDASTDFAASSIRLIAARQLSRHLELDGVIGASWGDRNRSAYDAIDGVFSSVSLAVRY